MWPSFLKTALDAAPLVLVDAGASGGLRPVWQSIQSSLYAVGFDPHPAACTPDQEQRDYARFFPYALGERQGTQTLYVTRSKGRSSLRPPNRSILNKFYDPGEFDVVETMPVPVMPLDMVLAEAQLHADFLKVDTQGTAWEVLEGASATLDTVLGLEVETEFLPRYEGQRLFADVHASLVSRGFMLFGLQPRLFTRTMGRQYGWQRGQPVYTYALYLREISRGSEKPRILKLIVLALLYGYLDYAAEVFRENQAQFMPDEVTAFEAYLKGTIPFQRRIRFPGRTWLADHFWAIWRELTRREWRA